MQRIESAVATLPVTVTRAEPGPIVLMILSPPLISTLNVEGEENRVLKATLTMLRCLFGLGPTIPNCAQISTHGPHIKGGAQTENVPFFSRLRSRIISRGSFLDSIIFYGPHKFGYYYLINNLFG